MSKTIEIELAPKIIKFFCENQNAKIYVLYGGRESGKTWSAAKVYLYKMLYSGKDGLVVREVEDKMEIGIHKTFKDVIESDDFLYEHFEVMRSKIRVREDSIFAKTYNRQHCIDFGGLKGRGQGLKGLGAYDFLFVDEAVELSEEQATLLRSSLARNIKLVTFYCFNPTRATDWIYERFVANYEQTKEVYGDRLAVLKINWQDNPFLAKGRIEEILMEKKLMKYEVYQHCYEGELAVNTEGALFSMEDIDIARTHEYNGLSTNEIRKMLDYVVIGVDPAVSTGELSDCTGIVVCGLSHKQKKLFVLEDMTGKYTPFEWASRVEYLWNKWNANYVIAEGNQGGDLIKDNLVNMSTPMFIRIVHARFGKITRAEPIAALYQKQNVLHINFYDHNKNEGRNHLGKLEHQMTTYSPFVKNAKSPDNMDAMVWAMTELIHKQKALYTPLSEITSAFA
jgi:PBSX family phage terminase large subunit